MIKGTVAGWGLRHIAGPMERPQRHHCIQEGHIGNPCSSPSDSIYVKGRSLVATCLHIGTCGVSLFCPDPASELPSVSELGEAQSQTIVIFHKAPFSVSTSLLMFKMRGGDCTLKHCDMLNRFSSNAAAI